MEKKNSELYRYQQESELKRKKKQQQQHAIVFLSQLVLFLLEKNRHFVNCP